MKRINYILRYYQAIKDGSVTVGTWIELVYEYIIKGLEQGLFIFDNRKANAAIEWIEGHCFHVEGDLAPNSLKLELWQKAFVSCIFGLCDPKTKKRQFREVFLVIGRKNGKSLLGAAIADYIFQVDGGFGTRVFTIAPKLDQADIIYEAVWAMAQLDPDYIAAKERIEKQQGQHKKIKEEPTMVKKTGR